MGTHIGCSWTQKVLLYYLFIISLSFYCWRYFLYYKCFFISMSYASTFPLELSFLVSSLLKWSVSYTGLTSTPNNSQGKKRKHINENGSINTEDKRTGKPKRDAYRIRSAKLVQKGKEIRNITGCEVFVDIVPTWENGKRSTFMSEGY